MSSLFAYAMNQPAGLHRCTGTNNRGDAGYAPALDAEPIGILCNFRYSRKEVLDKNGNRVISEAKLITETEMAPLDIVVYRGMRWTVISCEPAEDAFGNHDHWEVRL